MKYTAITALAAAAAFALTAPALADHLKDGRKLTATLSGANEIPGPGDADGMGMIVARVNPGRGQFCYTLTASKIAPATMAHIHDAAAGVAGPVVIALKAPTSGTSSGCVTISKELAQEIVQHPEEYYANVHNAQYPAGAIRAQLGK